MMKLNVLAIHKLLMLLYCHKEFLIGGTQQKGGECVHVCQRLLLEKKSMEVFVIAHYEMKQRKGREGQREGPI
jgi:hypothetical protein